MLAKHAACAATMCVVVVATGCHQMEDALRISWEKDILTIGADRLPGGKVEVWYLEAFCRRGSTDRDWRETTIPFTTRLVEADPKQTRLMLETVVDGKVKIDHEIRSGTDEVTFDLVLTNTSAQPKPNPVNISARPRVFSISQITTPIGCQNQNRTISARLENNT